MSLDVPLDCLLDEAESEPIAGWDFSWLGGRMSTAPLPWRFDEIVVRLARRSPDLLDLGTGGGEWLARLPYRPPRTVATESWEPNVYVARVRLGPLGVDVVPVPAAPDNVDQEPGEKRGALPFPDGSFSLVASRHESYVASEVARMLRRGGVFATQQIGGDCDDFYDLLGLPRPPVADRRWDLGLAMRQVEAAGLHVVASEEGTEVATFADVGALAWYLRAIPWTIPEFSIKAHRPNLEHLHQRMRTGGPASVRLPAFWLEALKET